MSCSCKHTTDNWKEVEKTSEAVLPESIVAFIKGCGKDEHPESHLINVLHKVQQQYGYLGREQLDAVAQLLQVPTAKVTGVATFYHLFRLQPRGRFMINVCMGTACYVNGAKQLAERFKEELGIDFGQTTSDGMFSLESTCCLGTCGLGPVVTINEVVHAKVQPDQIPALIRKAMDEAQAADGKKG